ncbi:hypothetical protein [Paenibacillus gansuensis]|uniref:DUF4190 domain-containing protein n=1 Tax=Paenibacillus gansuensis TaxID=306542 RepID=A0ABW5PLN7_9BACL
MVTTVITLSAIFVGAIGIEKRLESVGNEKGAQQFGSFGKWFAIGAAGYIVYLTAGAAIALLATLLS